MTLDASAQGGAGGAGGVGESRASAAMRSAVAIAASPGAEGTLVGARGTVTTGSVTMHADATGGSGSTGGDADGGD